MPIHLKKDQNGNNKKGSRMPINLKKGPEWQ